jgi:hypothetical protein
MGAVAIPCRTVSERLGIAASLLVLAMTDR